MSNISFTTDIVDEVAKEMGVSREAVVHCHNATIERLKHIVNKTDTTSIFIPHLGTLFVNFAYVNRMYDKLLRKKNIDLEEKEILASKIIKMEKYNYDASQQIKSKNNHLVNRHLQKSFLNNNYFVKFKSVEEIQEIQNEHYATRK